MDVKDADCEDMNGFVGHIHVAGSCEQGIMKLGSI